MSHALEKARVRNSLPVRREPFWAAPVARGQFIGLRKLSADQATWIARVRTEDGRQQYRSLGIVTPEFDFDQAKSAAKNFFTSVTEGIVTNGGVITVADACRTYVEQRRTTKSEGCAHDAMKRFERTVYGKPIGRHSLDKLRLAHVRDWRDGLKRTLSPASVNRTLTTLKAALNRAVKDRHVSPSRRCEWADAERLPNANKRRELYLDLSQRQAMLKVAQGAIRNLIEAAMQTGARPGELVRATVGQFDPHSGSMTFRSGKSGSRTVPLSPGAVRLFTTLSAERASHERMLVRDDGRAWGHSDWDEKLREVATNAGMPSGVVLYTMRHCFITAALTAGMPTLEVASIAGTSIQMLEDHYGHLVADAARKRLAKVALV